MGAKTEISEQILRAASDRIKHFGYAKTTMAEIAADLRMSAGNIYRFFASKLDIAEALARGEREEEFKAYSEIVQCSEKTAREKLASLLMLRLQSVCALAKEQPRIGEIADIIARERPQFIEQRLKEERDVLAAILREGIRSGEFDPADNVEFLAESVQVAVTRFRIPYVILNTPVEELERQLRGVVDLILRGLNRRSAISP